MHIRSLAILAGLGIFAITGCGVFQSKKKPASVVTLAEMAGSDGQTLDQNIRLRSGDSIDLRLGGVPIEEIQQVTGTYTVDTAGFVNVPSVGRVKASGLTQEAFQTEVENRYRAKGYYSNPTVTVSVPLMARFVNVGGEVKLPQRVAYTPDLTILSAITAAGGFTEYASQSRVRLYRGMDAIPVNMRRIRKNPGYDIPLQPGDTIEVMRSFF